jgi:hypothetical protein
MRAGTGLALAILVIAGTAGCKHSGKGANDARKLARVVSAPAATPAWLVVQARLEAWNLQDPQPDRVRIRLGRVDVVDMWGRFVWDSPVPAIALRGHRGRVAAPTAAQLPPGRHLRLTFDPCTRAEKEIKLTQLLPR